MYTLYYLNRNLQLGTIKTQTLDAPILIPEDLIFCDLRKGINFIKEPHECIGFTDIERLIMQSEFNDMDLIKDADFRYQNTYLNPLCQIDPVPYIVHYDKELGIIHFNMPMPATGIYELEESFDNGATWFRMLYYCSMDENHEIPDNAGYYIDNKLLGSSDFQGANNSLVARVYQNNELIRIKKDGVVVSQESFFIPFKS